MGSLAAAVWMALPLLLKESPTEIVHVDPLAADPAHPCVEVSGALWAPSSITVRLESFSVNVTNLNAAVALALSLYSVHNIHYSRRLRKVFTFLENVLGLARGSTASLLVTKLENEIGFTATK
ncbi:uncharacterized protein LOC135383214 [Ornithodoros turicata]|uniref:uncharacterized protein LOC135383214 n=1 Tax=Ornithodoros turicata TaxID=34597 RepID=UPI00313A1E51